METERNIDPALYDTKERIRRLEEQVKRVADGIDAMLERQNNNTEPTLSDFVETVLSAFGEGFKTFKDSWKTVRTRRNK